MKFARYLEETQTPEWKKAYIDYRGLKKRITAIRSAQETAEPKVEPGNPPLRPLSPTVSVGSHAPAPDRPIAHSSNDGHYALSETSAVVGSAGPSEDTTLTTGSPPRLRRRNTAFSPALRAQIVTPPRELSVKYAGAGHGDPHEPARHASHSGIVSGSSQKSVKLQWPPGSQPHLQELLLLLTPVERAFFENLDDELDKVESFFCDREKEMHSRYETLRQQLNELKDHRSAFYEAHPHSMTQHSWVPSRFTPLQTIPSTLRNLQHAAPKPHELFATRLSPVRLGKRRRGAADGSAPTEVDDVGEEEKIGVEVSSTGDAFDLQRLHSNTDAESVERIASPGMSTIVSTETPKRHRYTTSGDGKMQVPPSPSFDPEEYHEAKKQLKKAVRECYRGLETLNNYRTLNLIGFRKALKKFEKVTHIPAQEAYILEKIEPSAFASGANLEYMLHEMENLFAARFVRGDKKKAQARLRGGVMQKSHHFSTFRTGLLLGLGIPAFVNGLYKSFQPETRVAIPSWDGLLFIYGIFLVPVLFSLLVGLNLLVWHNVRINYVFIFELDVRTRLDHREYFEVPALLLSTLCYAFWLSFSRIGANTVNPSHWPLIWLAWAMFVWLNPLPILFRSSRYWLLKNIYRQLTSGWRRVEFQDFWMGDQFCSLAFTLGDLWFTGCAYNRNLQDWRVCATGVNWGLMFVIAALPFLARFIQSIRRWVDSRQVMHLVNAGKYGVGIIYYCTYYVWRGGGGGYGKTFVAWCILGVFYATYASSWDILMDWSFLQPHARYRWLRSEIIYTSYIPLYYLAIITNIIIRFEFMMYIPKAGINFTIRTFIAGMLEMLRRWQWNFFRLENEHVGNMDQYRVMREVPLPYPFDDPTHDRDSDGGDEDDEVERRSNSSSWRLRKISHGESLHVDVQ